jgi:cytochrome c biogenesis protein CcdA
MVGSILPIVNGERQSGRLGLSLGLHCLGCVVGAACLGAVASTVGRSIAAALSIGESTMAPIALSVLQGLVAARELDLIRFRMPQSYWQVPRRWLHTMPPRVACLAWGTVLGIGILNRAAVGTFHVLVIWMLVLGRPWLGAVIGVVYGIGRCVPLLTIASVTTNVERASRLMHHLTQWHPVMRVLNGVLLGSCAGWLLFDWLAPPD